MTTTDKITELLGPDAASLLQHTCKIPKESLHLPGPDWVDRIWASAESYIRMDTLSAAGAPL